MNALLTKQSAAIAGLSTSIANALVAFGLVDAVLSASIQAVLFGVGSGVLLLVSRDKTEGGGLA